MVRLMITTGSELSRWRRTACSSMPLARRSVSRQPAQSALFFGAAALTAITDNAALTYLGSLVEDISDQSKYSLVAGAVAGGGLTVIANAPNPAGFKPGARGSMI